MVRAIIAMTEGERLQKILARGGVASRREAELLITAGRVAVNGEVVRTLGTRVNPLSDRVTVDGADVQRDELKYFLFHKPRGVVCTMNDPEGRPSMREYLESVDVRVYPVGRLDFHTSGALLVTNDGALTNALLHPSKSVAKVYVAKVRGVAFDEQLQKMRDGVVLAPIADEPVEPKTAPADVELLRSAPSGEGSKRELGTTWLQITLREGRNRQIHRMAEAVGLFVMRLARVSFAGLSTEGMRAGQLRELTAAEVAMLRKVYLGIEPPVERRPGTTETKRRSSSGAMSREHQGEARHPEPRAGRQNARPVERGARPSERSTKPIGPRDTRRGEGLGGNERRAERAGSASAGPSNRGSDAGGAAKRSGPPKHDARRPPSAPRNSDSAARRDSRSADTKKNMHPSRTKG
jgi:23S rRNA pseudouridine2605 synthase